MTKSIAIGIDMPDDFPTEAHNEVVERLGRYPSVPEIAAGWNAVAIRFKSVANADARYTVSMKSELADSSPDERVIQQEELFAFFMNGYAALESFAYAVFAMGAMLCPADFPMKTLKDVKKITLRIARNCFTTSISGTVAGALTALIDDPKFEQWGAIRNELVHRCEPPRHIHITLGARTPHKRVWEIAEIEGGLIIDAQTTASHRRWLATALTNCVTEAKTFVAANFALNP
jgi:hypothetical protein